MAQYNKGASAERELMKLFWNAGFAVSRTAGSGKNQIPAPDLIVMGKGRKIVIEAKSWKSNYLSISAEQMEELLKWRLIGDAEVFVAWKYPNKGWVFLNPEDFSFAKRHSISFPNARKVGLPFNVLIGEQSQLPI